MYMDEKKLLEITSLDTICDEKWNYAVFSLNQSSFQACCHTPNNIVTEAELQEKGINAFLNSQQMINSRYELTQGIQTKDCSKCWKMEENKGPSDRTSNEKFWTHLKNNDFVNPNEEYSAKSLQEILNQVTDLSHPVLKSNKPTKLEIKLSNTCDLKCMYCNHNLSTQWAAEKRQYNEISEDEYKKSIAEPSELVVEKFWEWFNTVGKFSVEKIGITGGEPLLMSDFYYFLDKFIDQINEISHKRKSPIIIWIVTNLNTPPVYFQKFLNYLPKLTSNCELRLWISMETIGAKAEYIRNGLNWKRFENNLKNLLSLHMPNLKVGFNLAHNILSISSISDVIKYIEFLYAEYKTPLMLGTSCVVYPAWQNPMILTPDFSKYLDDAVEHMIQSANKNQLDTFCPTLDQ